MNCFIKTVGTIVSALLLVNLPFVSNAEDWSGPIGSKTYTGGTSTTPKIFDVNLTGDVTITGTIIIERHNILNIKNTSGSAKTIKVVSDVSPMFKNMGTLNV
ncbi:MAG: hypothetical protein ACI31D_04905, partial [Candidatus Limisoma sp.]